VWITGYSCADTVALISTTTLFNLLHSIPTTPVASSGMALKSIDPNDCNVPNAGTDGISSLNWSPTANILVSTNWDSTVSCWEVHDQGGRIQANPKAQSKVYIQKFQIIFKHSNH
jgi:WD40 repeat protein